MYTSVSTFVKQWVKPLWVSSPLSQTNSLLYLQLVPFITEVNLIEPIREFRFLEFSFEICLMLFCLLFPPVCPSILLTGLLTDWTCGLVSLFLLICNSAIFLLSCWAVGRECLFPAEYIPIENLILFCRQDLALLAFSIKLGSLI